MTKIPRIASAVWTVINLRWSTQIMSSLRKHLDSMSSMLQGEAAKQAADLSKLEFALKRLGQLRAGTTLLFGFNIIIGVVVAIFPVFLQWWFFLALLAVLASFGSLYSLRPQGWRI
jgi:hypothetical protein